MDHTVSDIEVTSLFLRAKAAPPEAAAMPHSAGRRERAKRRENSAALRPGTGRAGGDISIAAE